MVEVKSVEDLVRGLGISCKRDFELKKKSPIKAGGICDFFLEPNSQEQLIDLVRGLKGLEKDFMVVGFLSNVLFRDGRIRTPIIHTGKLKDFRLEGTDCVYAEAGCSLSYFAKELTQRGFEGFSGLTGFPATIGGAIYMNASCYGNAISDCLESVQCIDRDGNIVRFDRRDLGFSWRHSIFHDFPKSYVIVSAIFKLTPGDPSALLTAQDLAKNHRLEYQEHRLPNLGSTFATANIYREISRVNFKYRIGFFVIRMLILWAGRIFMPHSRTKIWAAAINRFTQRFFDIKPSGGVGVSRHTFNCVVNLGDSTAADIIYFVENIKRKIGIRAPLEIEIVDKIE